MEGQLAIGRLLTRRVILAIVLVGVAGVATYATATTFLVQHNFPAGPKPAVPAVRITSSCSNLVQAVSGPGVFTNATGTFVENGTTVGILYACSVTSPPYQPAFTVVQETPVNAPAYPTVIGLSMGVLYVIPDDRPHCSPTTVELQYLTAPQPNSAQATTTTAWSSTTTPARSNPSQSPGPRPHPSPLIFSSL